MIAWGVNDSVISLEFDWAQWEKLFMVPPGMVRFPVWLSSLS